MLSCGPPPSSSTYNHQQQPSLPDESAKQAVNGKHAVVVEAGPAPDTITVALVHFALSRGDNSY